VIDVPQSPVRLRVVGAALRRYREHLGFDLAEAARILDCDKSKISRIETGQRGIRARDLRDLLGEYGVGENELATLTEIGDPRKARRGWWQDYTDLVPPGVLDYLVLEAAASEILLYDAQQVPGLLQTPDYARAVIDAGPGSYDSEVRERLAAMRQARQQAVIGEGCPAVSVVIGEAALRQGAGGAVVMQAQRRWLAGTGSACPWVRVQVLPFGSVALPGSSSGPMTILRYKEAPSLGVVHLPGLSGGGFCLVDAADVACYVTAFTQLRVSALSAEDSVRMLLDSAS
jgi:transcriptional regulator with XRE-family HTH domain